MNTALYLFGSAVTGIIAGIFMLVSLYITRESRKDTHVQSEVQQGDTYFKQAVELASSYYKEIGRLQELVDSLERKLKEQEDDCAKKIQLLQGQLADVISTMPPRSKQRFEETQQVRNGDAVHI